MTLAFRVSTCVVAVLTSLGVAGVARAEASQAGPVPTESGSRGRAGIIPWNPSATGGPAGSPRFHTDVTPVCANPKLAYFGGPVISTPIVVPVFWNSLVNAQLQANMEQFYADVMQSGYWGWLEEYDTVGLAGGTEQAILPGSALAAVTLTPVVCPGTTTGACNLTDAQVQAELAREIGLGALPAPTLDCTGNTQTIYMIEFPHNVTLAGPSGSGRSCANNGFCGYHNTGTFGAANTPLVYAVLMDEFTGPCATGCGGNTSPLANSTISASHELIEAVTDPDIGLVTQGAYASPAAWADNNNGCGEIGDICADGSAGDTITVSGRTWTVQEVWSNKQTRCTSSGPSLPICSGTTTTACRRCFCGDDGAACGGATPVCETAAANVLFGSCEACTGSKVGACTGTETCAQSATLASDDVCAGACVPVTMCPAGIVCGAAPDGCGATLNCGTCAAGETCNASHTCVSPVVDAGADTGSAPDATANQDATTAGDAAPTVDGGGNADAAGDATLADAEPDTGTVDAAMAPVDAAGPDAGTVDASSTTDAVASADAAVATDAARSSAGDASAIATAGDAARDGGGPAAAQPAGCGCRTAPAPGGTGRWWVALAPLALLARRGRSRASASRA